MKNKTEQKGTKANVVDMLPSRQLYQLFFFFFFLFYGTVVSTVERLQE